MTNAEHELYLNDYIAAIEKALIDYLPITDRKFSYICEAMRYSLEAGGKRVRPVLTLEFCKLCGAEPMLALGFACAVEYIHTYSLIHDDLPCMDDDDMRRGKPSSHIKFGEANALLSGDALLTHAFSILSCEKNGVSAEAAVKACRKLAEYSGVCGMIGGQYLDLYSEGRQITAEEICELDLLKTCALIRAACELGCIAADASGEEIAAAGEFADNLGLAFQLVDDILDVTSTPEKLGKPTGSDEEKNKSTYLSMFGMEKAVKQVEMYTDKALSALYTFRGDTEFLRYLTVKLLNREN